MQKSIKQVWAVGLALIMAFLLMSQFLVLTPANAAEDDTDITITYHANGGYFGDSTENTELVKQYKTGTYFNLDFLEIPNNENPNMVFRGWAETKDAKTALDFVYPRIYNHINFMAGPDCVKDFYAVWEDRTEWNDRERLNEGEVKHLTGNEGEPVIFTFVPKQDGKYTFTSFNMQYGSPVGWIYEENQPVGRRFDSGHPLENFSVTYQMTAGKMYYLEVIDCGSYDTYDFCVTIYPDSEKQVTLTLDTQGGDLRRYRTLLDNCEVQAVADRYNVLGKVYYAEKTGQYFLGWSTDRTKEGIITRVPKEDATLYAIWEEANYVTVTLNGNGFGLRTKGGPVRELKEKKAAGHPMGALFATLQFYRLPYPKDGVWPRDIVDVDWALDPLGKNRIDDITTWIPTADTTLYAIAKDGNQPLDLEKIEEKAATCTKAGNKEYWINRRDGRLFADENGTEELNKIPVIKKSGHSWDKGKVTKEATVFKTGVRTYICDSCGTKTTKVIPKLTPTIRLSAAKKSIKAKKSFTLAVSRLAKGDRIISVKSGKTSIASVKKAGTNKYKITGKKKGKAVITVTLKSGKKATCTVTVK